MSSLSLGELLKPISDSAPCGPNVEYDPAFAAMEVAARGTPERFTGSTVIPAEPPVWAEVYEAALKLAARTRDVRIAVLLTRAAARIHGLDGFLAGLSLVAGLLDQHWDCVYPRLDEAAAGDATMRLNALLPLCDFATGLGDFRACGVLGHPNALTVRLIELAWANTEPLPGEPKPTQPAIVKSLQEARQQDIQLLERMKSVHETALQIDRLLEQHVGNLAPDLAPLMRITAAVAQAAAAAEGSASVGEPTLKAPAPSADTAKAQAGPIRTRDDVVRALGAACEWIEQHEPSHPAPLLIRRAQRLMSKSFIELVRDLAPEGVSQVERIAGVPAP